MSLDTIRMVGKALCVILPYTGTYLSQRVAATYHSFTYKEVPNPKNVVIIGGSFAGTTLAKRLSESLPTGYKTVLIERNSHFNFPFVFPRFSVLEGHETHAFIPYDGLAKDAPKGIFERVQDTAVGLTDTHVLLRSGRKIDYSYLAIATGCSQPLPSRLVSTELDACCAELKGVQRKIKEADNIALVGAGAVGVELATDIKSYYPEKKVTLVHSRGQVLNQFGKRLSDYVLPVLEKQGIRVLLNERPQLPSRTTMAKDSSLTFSDGRQEAFDLVIPCTGQTPNTSIPASFLPGAISPTTSRILVKPTLQIKTTDDSLPNPPIFAFGDVAESGGPQMARATHFQSEVVLANILSMIAGLEPTRSYKPMKMFEGAIKLTLGKTQQVAYGQDEDGSDFLLPGNGGKEDLEVGRWWKMMGADFKKREGGGVEVGVVRGVSR